MKSLHHVRKSESTVANSLQMWYMPQGRVNSIVQAKPICNVLARASLLVICLRVSTQTSTHPSVKQCSQCIQQNMSSLSAYLYSLLHACSQPGNKKRDGHAAACAERAWWV